MVTLDSLPVPLIAAPMAGGVSTPGLVRAVADAGALGFLAAGYQPVDALAEQVDQCRAAGVAFGVNLFVPDATPLSDADLAALEGYREALAPLARRLGVEVGPARQDDDGYADKVTLLLERPAPVVSFTFGLPDARVVAALHGVGTRVLATVASVRDAARAVATGVDALVVQGPDAGGHRATLDVHADPDPTPLPELLAGIQDVVDVALVATGGLCTGEAIRAVLDAGAVAAQLGTAFLLADEAGTSAVHRAALRDPAFTATALTRAFSGRPARGLENGFVRRFGSLAPAAYPAVNAMTGPLRRAAAASGDADGVHLWAGTGWREAPSGAAARIVADLWAAASS